MFLFSKMRTTLAVAAFLASSTSILAAPVKGGGFLGLNKASGNETTKTYSAVFSKEEDPTEFYQADHIDKLLPSCVSNAHCHVNKAFAACTFDATQDCSEAVNSMTEISTMNEALEVRTYATLTGSPWGLQRVSSNTAVAGSSQDQSFTYTFDSTGNLGQGVDIYIIDTGVRTSHAVFSQGGVARASLGFSAVDGETQDGDGHGTHVAGTCAGAKFGISQNANIIAVKALDDTGSGSSTAVLSALNYVMQQHTAKKAKSGFKGSVINMSLGLGGRSSSLEEALKSVNDAGVHVAVAAGNDATDACTSSPSALGGSNSAVVSVGAMNIDNEVASFSNIGKCVDVYAPGEQVLSSWNTGDTIINFLSGTSMASPHVAGMMAYFIGQDPTQFGQSPTALKAHILSTAVSGAVSGSVGGGNSLLLNNGASGSSKRLVKNYVVPGQDFSVHSTDSPVRL
ncbi:peptidase S8/S53 domain-containing protein [Lophiotrema nucula]|uniref:Peptidase S8/S53 domain-containing protein n=1 Tax=Lophiotrema nucula TaxID=690887 RepID=A0A6A5YK00_9PLEO|nr:peptidase S8/S53 domain-containing protein [Lophiotrema nucula]